MRRVVKMDPVSAYMVKTIRDIDAGSSVRDAAEKLDSFGVGSLLVKKDSDYVGVVSEQEITRQLVAKNLGSNNTSVSDIMNPDIDYIDQEETMSKAIDIEREKTPLPCCKGWKNRGGYSFGKRPAGFL